jgi:nitric oxide reductase subunit C
MRQVRTKTMAANIFYGGSLFFIIVFVALTVRSHFYIVNTSTDSEGLTESVTRGKHLWEPTAASIATRFTARARTSPRRSATS